MSPETMNLPDTILLDYSCFDNIQLLFQADTVQRVYINYCQLVSNYYETYPDNRNVTTIAIGNLIKHHSKVATIKSFKYILKYPKAISPLWDLVLAGGIWDIDLNNVFETLHHCCVENVKWFFFSF